MHEAKEINFIKDILTKYENAPVKAFFGKESYADASAHKAKSFTEGQAAELQEYLKNELTQLEEIIKKVFTSFDTDKSGFIDSNEL